ncbi:MAG: sigma-70 family RNA polymerase sigma factor, partial [Marinovum sp.]|nr:sigma-70 family RNA polymerase sigma factor [Marinovum sp.]
SKAMRGNLVEALKSLPTQQSRVLQLYYVEELNVYEIAQVLDLSPGRVSQVKSEAFKTLKSKLVSFAESDG